MTKSFSLVLVIVLTLVAGFLDSQGFFHSSQVWKNDQFVTHEAVKSLFSFVAGTILFWFSIKYLQQLGVVSAEMQTIIWFVVTIVGVAIASGKFFQWNIIDQSIGIAVFIGIGLLLFRTGA
ncbi:hypothetical protein A2866_05320 [Candidatus Roizmanbacteria bacterium RIFCSPHIGHO2_01_FULL_39_8]|uniref:EamA domain-containing protein n=2 Tax=Candidatus Roizmaniibacteriota TaxID=1752723 RepID=A0A1F7GU46_9BACT|nr:MAG: hypothetical protein A2866_05320 [Candidatus Roizmanbacteria bacterium RIFCSPHIGHO2_01_FULL_39_8]OGK25555.1 MAG: hypothetical protein A3C28_01720 [Candidatus Roizmanbacteria bacterium RIFCSPHIGHO2_02_FULL_39_9]